MRAVKLCRRGVKDPLGRLVMFASGAEIGIEMTYRLGSRAAPAPYALPAGFAMFLAVGTVNYVYKMSAAVVLIPFYLLLVYLQLIDTWEGLILCYSTFNLAFVVVIMRDIFRDVSTEIEDAAKVGEDGEVALPLRQDANRVAAARRSICTMAGTPARADHRSTMRARPAPSEVRIAISLWRPAALAR